MSENEQKKKKPLKGTGGSLSGSVVASGDEDDESSSTKIISNYDEVCPACGGHFSSNSAYRNHLPCNE